MDVRQVLTYVEHGDADAGLVYQSDAQSSDLVRSVATAPPESHEPIVYCAAIVKESRHVPRAAEFIEYLTSPPAQKIFKELGFTPTGDSQ
jgi:molybdate transport system substrate-binding protein